MNFRFNGGRVGIAGENGEDWSGNVKVWGCGGKWDGMGLRGKCGGLGLG